jgi:signal transduction histidine kinase
VAVATLLEQVVAGVRARAELQGVELHWQAPDEALTIEADAGQLRQLLYNMLFNALEAQPGGGRIDVLASAGKVDEAAADSAAQEQGLLLEVCDRGTGLPAQLGERIFEPFISTKEAGTGLGLSICRRIVEAHGGSLEARDRPDGGAIFTVRLPLARSISLWQHC